MKQVKKKTGSRSDLVGPMLAIGTAVLAIVTIAASLYWAHLKQLDVGKTLLLNILTLTFSAVCTIWVGRWSARRENMSFIRAALRTTYGIHEGLQAAEGSALDGISRMKARSQIPPELASDLWEELLGRVLDQLRSLMRQAQETVANWQEFGPEEVERLTAAETAKAQAIEEVTTAVAQARSMLNSIKELGGYDTAALGERVRALEQEKSRLTATSALAIPSTGEARRLLAMGASEEAAAAYSALIDIAPEHHTLYISRARARYLSGDTAGALDDLGIAESKKPHDPLIERLRADIAAGRKLVPVSAPIAPYKPYVFEGNSALASGDGDKALQDFRKARDAGLHAVFASENEAMAMLVCGRYEESRTLIAEMSPPPTGPFVRAQAAAIVALADALEGRDSSSLAELERTLAELQVVGIAFSVAESPLQFLFAGLERKGVLAGPAQRVVATLRGSTA